MARVLKDYEFQLSKDEVFEGKMKEMLDASQVKIFWKNNILFSTITIIFDPLSDSLFTHWNIHFSYNIVKYICVFRNSPFAYNYHIAYNMHVNTKILRSVLGFLL